ncbi:MULTISPECIES: VC_2705 family sodium/solute symporter [Rhodomicrobium]|uniref:VC_2705 family sodium/solute symporter n=1 Tax=Rhodomicrobium TaxID=1068 RepID=UPI000B4B3B0A|nr:MULTISPECIES: VC_2705 family sodium/solute symporter [Rhodomicrobium]
MSLNSSYPSVNPRLGTSFGIFTSAFASLVLMLIILEQLGLERDWISQLIIVLPMLFYAGIGLLVRTSSVEDFFISGQRVPPLYNGFALSANLVSGAGLMGLIGAFFFIGYDALPIALGWCAGLGVMSVLFAPYLRKTGAYTLPGFFGIRFSSRILRLVAALALLPPLLMLLAAEFRVGQMVGSVFLNLDRQFVLEVGVFFLVVTVVFGGMRSLTWTQCAQFIVVVLGITVPLIAVSVMVTNLPLPQLAHGGVLNDLTQLELAKSLGTDQGTLILSKALPGASHQALTRPFVELFGAMSSGDFLALTLCIALGTAVLPTQIARLSTPPTVSAVRKSFGWAALLVGLMVLTIPAYAAFVKFQIAKELLGVPLAQIPDWGNALAQLGLITLSANQLDPALGSAKVLFDRDSVALMLPVINGFPFVMIGVVGAAAVAAVMAAAGGQLVAMANVLSNDVYYLFNRSASSGRRLLVARLAMIGFAVLAFSIASSDGVDPLRLMIWAASLCAGTFFAPLAMAIWWRGLTSFGALCGMAAGFAATAAYIAASASGAYPWFGVDGLTAGLLGVPASALAAFTGSLLSPSPDAATLELVDEMRIPSGETVHGRLARLAARGKAPKP